MLHVLLPCEWCSGEVVRHLMPPRAAACGAEAHHLPSSHRKAASQVDEVTVAWALIPFQLVARTSKPTTEVAPLMCGRLMAPVALSHEVYLARKKR